MEPVPATTAEGRCASEPAISRRHADHVSEPRTGTSAPLAAYGYAHFTKYMSMSLEDFVQKLMRSLPKDVLQSWAFLRFVLKVQPHGAFGYESTVGMPRLPVARACFAGPSFM